MTEDDIRPHTSLGQAIDQSRLDCEKKRLCDTCVFQTVCEIRLMQDANQILITTTCKKCGMIMKTVTENRILAVGTTSHACPLRAIACEDKSCFYRLSRRLSEFRRAVCRGVDMLDDGLCDPCGTLGANDKPMLHNAAVGGDELGCLLW